MHFNLDKIEQIQTIHRIWRQWRLIYIESNLFKCSATIPTYKMWKFSQLDLPAQKIWIGSFHLEFWSQIGTNSEKFEDEGRLAPSCDQPGQVPEEPPPGTGTSPPPPPPPGTGTLQCIGKGWLIKTNIRTSSQSSEMRYLSPNLKLWITDPLTGVGTRRCYRI